MGVVMNTRRSARVPELQRFLKYVSIGEGCWKWTGFVNVQRNGYGMWAFRGESKSSAHRAMWRLAYGPIPEGMRVLHHCDNPSCVRPDHLYLGTAADNGRDMSARRRNRTKLMPEQVRLIRKHYTLGQTMDTLAAEYSVSQTTIAKIIHRRTWKQVK